MRRRNFLALIIIFLALAAIIFYVPLESYEYFISTTVTNVITRFGTTTILKTMYKTESSTHTLGTYTTVEFDKGSLAYSNQVSGWGVLRDTFYAEEGYYYYIIMAIGGGVYYKISRATTSIVEGFVGEGKYVEGIFEADKAGTWNIRVETSFYTWTTISIKIWKLKSYSIKTTTLVTTETVQKTIKETRQQTYETLSTTTIEETFSMQAKRPLTNRYLYITLLGAGVIIIAIIAISKSYFYLKLEKAIVGHKKCSNCGAELPLEAEYCHECGVKQE